MSDADDRVDLACDVLVVGAGPVGLTMAMELAKRGIDLVIIESRSAESPAHPKCNTTSARSMEIFRRLGLAEKVRRTGLPADHPCDIAYATRLLGYELGRFQVPSWSERFSANDTAFDGGWPTAEPPHRVSQLYLEPVMRNHARDAFGVQVRHDTEFVALKQEVGHVRVICHNMLDGTQTTIRASYVVGCDGARSPVRKAIDVRLLGDDNLAKRKSVYLRSPDLRKLLTATPAWMTWILNPERGGCVVALDGKEEWLCHCRIAADEALDAVDTRTAVEQVIGRQFAFEILAEENWIARRLVASRYRVGNVFVAGDAAHLWIPFAGFGMNAGIEDASSLAWLLAGLVAGWGGDGLLDAYEAERRPVGEQVSHAVARLAANALMLPIPCELEEASDSGARARSQFGAAMLQTDAPQFNPVGLNFGTVYAGSSIILHGPDAPPDLVIDHYQPTTVPGCRAPDIALRDGTRLHDQLGTGFTMVHSGNGPALLRVAAEAARLGVPMQYVDLSGDEPAALLYQKPFVLVRPDQRVAWRGDEIAAAWGDTLRLCVGLPPTSSSDPAVPETIVFAS